MTMTRNDFKVNKKILVSDVDSYGQMTLPSIVTDFMNTATLLSEQDNYGVRRMNELNLFWLTTKTRIMINKAPLLLDDVSISTWNNIPNPKRCYKEYAMKKGDEVLVSGKTEWALYDPSLNKTVEVNRILPTSIEIDNFTFIPDNFRVFPSDFNGEVIGEYKCNSNDIDIGKHMHNVAYIKALMSLFSCATWHKLGVKDFEVHYLKPCLEGETIVFSRMDKKNISYIKGLVNNNEVCQFILEMA